MNITININAPVHNLIIVNDDQEKAKELEKEKQKEEQLANALLKALNLPLEFAG